MVCNMCRQRESRIAELRDELEELVRLVQECRRAQAEKAVWQDALNEP